MTEKHIYAKPQTDVVSFVPLRPAIMQMSGEVEGGSSLRDGGEDTEGRDGNAKWRADYLPWDD